MSKEKSCRRGGESPAAGEERVLLPGRRKRARAALPEGKSESRPTRGKEREPPYKRERARENGTQGVAYTSIRECMCGKAGDLILHQSYPRYTILIIRETLSWKRFNISNSILRSDYVYLGAQEQLYIGYILYLYI